MTLFTVCNCCGIKYEKKDEYKNLLWMPGNPYPYFKDSGRCMKCNSPNIKIINEK